MADDDVLGNVRAVLPALAEAAATTDRDRRVDDAAIGSLTEAGLFRMMLPTRFSGLESTPLELFTAIRVVSSACTSTGWVASTLCLGTWQVGLFDEQAQQEVWGADPGTLVTSTYQFAGQLRPDGERFRLSGQWRYVSGYDHCAWLFVGALVTDEAGDPIGHALVLVPRTDVEMRSGPDCVGLRAAANAVITIDDATVPAHRVYGARLRVLQESKKGRRALRPLHRYAVTAMFSAAMTSPLIGAAQGALAQFTEPAGPVRPGVRLLEEESVQVAVARASYEIDAAALQIERDFAEMHAHVLAADVIPAELRARVRRDQVIGAELAATAVDRLLRIGGRPALTPDAALQRAWRDIHAGAAHRVNEVETVLAMVGRSLLGHGTDDDVMFV